MSQPNVPDIIPAIFQGSPNSRVRTSMVFGSGLESGWSDTATNPSGATGPFQILLPVHPDITFQQAENPSSATAYMLPAYRAAVAQVPDSLWKTNPEVAAEQVVITAEQPGGAFPSQGQPVSYGSEGVDVVNQRWGQTTQYLTGPWNPGKDINLSGDQNAKTASFMSSLPSWLQVLLFGPDALIPGLNPLGGGGLGGISKIINFLAHPQDALERIGLVLFGAVMILIGLYVMSGSHAVRSAAGEAGTAPVSGAATRVRTRASGAAAAREKQVKLQSRAMDIGERRVKVQEARQQRLSVNAQLKAPSVGKHAKGGGGKHERRSES